MLCPRLHCVNTWANLYCGDIFQGKVKKIMKQKLCGLVVIAGIFSMLTGCATLAPKSVAPTLVTQGLSSDEAKQLNLMIDTAKDNQQATWHSDDGKTLYQLMTSNTFVNDQGRPCRSYTLLVAPSYARKQQSTGVACRDDNAQWQFNSN
jgi:hypothetical protein